MKIYINGVSKILSEQELSEIKNLATVYPEPNPTPEEQSVTIVREMVRSATTLTDNVALSVPDLLPTWEELLKEGNQVEKGVCLMYNGQCYRVEQAVTPIESQKPGDEGMLAVYRPIDKEHAGTQADPIPFVYGMDCYEGKYYSHEGNTYLCTGDMIPCVWAPGTPGVYQWELV